MISCAFFKAENIKMEAFILQVHEQESFGTINGSLSRNTYLPLRFFRRYSHRPRQHKYTHTQK